MSGAIGQGYGAPNSSHNAFGFGSNANQNLFASHASSFGGSSTGVFGGAQSPFSSGSSRTSWTLGSSLGGRSMDTFGASMPCTSASSISLTQGSLFPGNSPGVFGAQLPPISSAQELPFGGSSTGVFSAPESPFLSDFSQTSWTLGSSLGASSTSAIGASSPFTSASSTSFTQGPFVSNSAGVFRKPPPTISSPQESPFGGSSNGVFGAPHSFCGSSSGAFGSPSSPFSSASIFGGSSTGVFGAPSPFSSTSSSILGFRHATSGSAPMFGTNSLGSAGQFNSTTSKGSTGGPPFTPLLGHRSSSSASLSIVGDKTNTGHTISASKTAGSTTVPSFQIHNSPCSETSAGPFRISYSFLTSPRTFTSGLPTMVGFTNNKSSNQIAGPVFGQSPSVLGTKPTNIFSTLQTTGPIIWDQTKGTRIKPYECTTIQEAGKNVKYTSISAMSTYESKSHEELRWEDAELNSGGQQNPVSNRTQELNRQPSKFPRYPATLGPFFPVSSMNMNTSSSIKPLPTFINFPNNQVSNQTPDLERLPSNFLLSTPYPLFTVSSTNVGSSTNPNVDHLSGLKPLPTFPTIDTKKSMLDASNLNSSVPPQVPITPSTVASQFLATLPISNKQSSQNFQLPTEPLPLWNNGGVSFECCQPQPGVCPLPLHRSSATGEVTDRIVAVKDPFRSEPATSQPSIGHFVCSSLVQHGISSMPVFKELVKPRSTRVSSLLKSRNYRAQLLAVKVRKYHPSTDGPKVPFFDRGEETQFIKAYNCVVPRENPRSVFAAASTELTYARTCKEPPIKNLTAVDDENENAEKNPINSSIPNSLKDDQTEANGNAKEAHTLMIPKLQRPDYYTEPSIEKITSIESCNPGFCCQVKDFVVGRKGYGWVKFFGETDVRGLNLDSIVQFNDRELIVYDDESEKPAVGQGLNKAAEATLLNVICMDKTGKQYSSGKMVDKFVEKLKKVAERQGAEFSSYDPVDGIYKFVVQHF
ncbi:nuclear pore complex protein NUP98A-like isoform X3 [Amaranthus tricolor]|uniref:nuclear pore complex protein NUP98A-like isoform X3 n=1 Tax=Amaranthus tricolor TaxID=29722 RepID=UPI00258C98D8|nr:nuclear pore complex protein NUP98A-like isoform X3 [Amaranthus tricolor]